MFAHKAIYRNRRNMKHIICYAYNKFGHVAKECRNNSMEHHRQYGKQLDKNIDIRKSKKDGSPNKQEKEEKISCCLALY